MNQVVSSGQSRHASRFLNQSAPHSQFSYPGSCWAQLLLVIGIPEEIHQDTILGAQNMASRFYLLQSPSSCLGSPINASPYVWGDFRSRPHWAGNAFILGMQFSDHDAIMDGSRKMFLQEEPHYHIKSFFLQTASCCQTNLECTPMFMQNWVAHKRPFCLSSMNKLPSVWWSRMIVIVMAKIPVGSMARLGSNQTPNQLDGG